MTPRSPWFLPSLALSVSQGFAVDFPLHLRDDPPKEPRLAGPQPEGIAHRALHRRADPLLRAALGRRGLPRAHGPLGTLAGAPLSLYAGMGKRAPLSSPRKFSGTSRCGRWRFYGSENPGRGWCPMAGNVKQLFRLYGLYARMDLNWFLQDRTTCGIVMAAELIANIASVSGVLLLAARFGGVGGPLRGRGPLHAGLLSAGGRLFPTWCSAGFNVTKHQPPRGARTGGSHADPAPAPSGCS